MALALTNNTGFVASPTLFLSVSRSAELFNLQNLCSVEVLCIKFSSFKAFHQANA